MKQYTLGFVFNCDLARVALIQKKKPAWMAGLLNGLGGKIEEHESPLACVSREVREESSLDIPPPLWTHDFILNGPDWRVFGFSHVLDTGLIPVQQTTEEEVSVWAVSQILNPFFGRYIMRNLPVLISLCRDRSGIIKPVTLNDGIENKPSIGDTAGEA